jgi:hypothetical protein
VSGPDNVISLRAAQAERIALADLDGAARALAASTHPGDPSAVDAYRAALIELRHRAPLPLTPREEQAFEALIQHEQAR